MTAVVFEEHASVLPYWAACGWRDATVVVLDAHLDLQHLDEARIERLRRCRDADALRELESPHPFSASPDACFGIEDFLYPAARLGLVGRIVWVAPPHVLRRGFGPALERLVQMEGVSLEDIDSLAVTPGGWVSGRLMGIPLIVCAAGHLGLLDLPADWQLDIDVDYFVELPGDRVWADPVETLAHLRTLRGCPSTLTISRSVGSGFTPLRLRFLADLLAAAWVGDAGPPTVPWHTLLAAEQARAAGDHASCRALCAAIVDPAPAQAAAWQLAAATDAPEERLRAWRDAAARADPAHAPDLVRDIAAAHSRRLPFGADQLRHWRAALAGPEAPLTPAQAGPAWVMLGLLSGAVGRWAEARAADTQAAAAGHEHPELALELAAALAERGEGGAAAPYAARALAHPSTRVRALAVLYRLASLQNEADGARRWCEAEAKATPANPWALQRLAEALAATGEPEAARAAERQARHLTQRLDAAATRLAGLALRNSAQG